MKIDHKVNRNYFFYFQFVIFAQNPILTIAEQNSANSALIMISQNRIWLDSALETIDPWLFDNVVPSSATSLKFSQILVLFFIIPYFKIKI